MEKVKCRKEANRVTFDEAMRVFHLADETCMECLNYENCKDEFWKRNGEEIKHGNDSHR